MADKQNSDKKPVDYGEVLVEALKRTPGNIAGGGVDLVNMALGLLTGKGLKGFVDKPVGGSESINQAVGLKQGQDPAQQAAEAVLGMFSPGSMATQAAKTAGIGGAAVLGMLKTLNAGGAKPAGKSASQRGVIIPGTPETAELLNVKDVVDRAAEMSAAGKSAFSIEQEAMNALAAKRNPGGAFIVYIGPDGTPRIKIDPAVAQLNPTFEKSLQTEYTRGRGGQVTLPKSMGPSKDDMLGPATLLSDILYHPSLFDISPAARTMQVQTNFWYDLLQKAGGYNKDLNTIALPMTTYPPTRMSRDPAGALVDTLLHEATHGIQMENKVRTGGTSTIASIKEAINAAKTQGSYRSPEELDRLEKYVNALEKMPDSPAKASALETLYRSNYGEFEARLGSQYGKSFPSQVERGSIY